MEGRRMAITATKKFTYIVDGQTRIYFPGSEIDDEGAALWSLEQGFGEDRDDAGNEHRAIKGSPENKAWNGPGAPAKGEKMSKKQLAKLAADSAKAEQSPEAEISVAGGSAGNADEDAGDAPEAELATVGGAES
jgi:hypothetical protein